MLSDYAWLEIANALNITKHELPIAHAVFDNLHEAAIPKKYTTGT